MENWKKTKTTQQLLFCHLAVRNSPAGFVYLAEINQLWVLCGVFGGGASSAHFYILILIKGVSGGGL